MVADTEKPLFTIRLTDFSIEVSAPEYQRSCTASEAFAELRQAAAGAYDKIEDVDLFAHRIREGDLP